jgi:hypothetical protein
LFRFINLFIAQKKKRKRDTAKPKKDDTDTVYPIFDESAAVHQTVAAGIEEVGLPEPPASDDGGGGKKRVVARKMHIV